MGDGGLVEESGGKMTEDRRRRTEAVKGLEGHGVRRLDERVEEEEGGER